MVAAPVGAAALVGLAACGTGDASSSTSGSTGGQPDASTAPDPADSAMAAYAQCMQDNGVTLPERPARGEGGPPQDGAPPSGAPAAGGGPGGLEGAPGQAPPGVDADTWAAAQKACVDVAPAPPGAEGSAT